MVHRVDGDAPGLHGPFAWGTCGITRGQNREFGPILPAVDCSAWDMDWCPQTLSFPRMYFSSASWVMPLFTIIGCFERGRPMSPYARSHPVAVFVSQASAMDQCDQRRATYLSSLAPAILGSPRNIRRCDTEAASPSRTRRNTRRVRSTRVQDVLAGVLSPVTVSDQAPGAIIYGCRPPILPVTVWLRGLRGPCVVCSTASSSLASPPAGDDLVAGASVPDQEATVVHASVLLNNPSTDLEDKLCHLSPLPEVISPLPESGNDVPMSPSLVSGDGGARHGSLCLRDMGVSGTTPGGEHTSYNWCFPDLLYVAGDFILSTCNFSSNFGLCFAREPGIDGPHSRWW